MKENDTSRPIPSWLLALSLALTTMAVYFPATQNDFVNFDDNLYVTSNHHVNSGLTIENLKWALVHPVSNNWHPVTMFSHILDCQFFGLNPLGHHLVNVLWHALNAALVFLLLFQVTKAQWRSLLVAMFFALHPLHVESVAWISERKDVLSSFFGLCALIFYARYAQKFEKQKEISAHFLAYPAYWLALFFFGLGLMCKSMLVTWPLVMLLMDFWPLGRFTGQDWRRLFFEKIPFLVLTMGFCIITFIVQNQTGAVKADYPLDARIENALVSYCRYVGKIFWPTDLAVFYPHPGYWPAMAITAAVLALTVVSFLLFRNWRRYPFLLMGWLWFMVTLVPVIGLVQIGDHSMADRYSYIPSIGILIMLVWGVNELAQTKRFLLAPLVVITCFGIVICSTMTWHQLGYWQNSETLFKHAIAVTKNNYRARINLGIAFFDQGRYDDAISQYQEAIRLKPNIAHTHNDLGNALVQKGETDEAMSEYQEAIRLKPDLAEAYNNLGNVLAGKGRMDEAISQYQEAVRLRPDYAKAYCNLGNTLAAQDRWEPAADNYRKSLALDAVQPQTFVHLGMTLTQLGKTQEALDQYQHALDLDPNLILALNNMAWTMATTSDDGLRNGSTAVQLAERACQLTQNGQPVLLGTLAAAYAEAGRFQEAVATAENAEQLAIKTGMPKVADRNRQLLELYQAGKPYHEPSIPHNP